MKSKSKPKLKIRKQPTGFFDVLTKMPERFTIIRPKCRICKRGMVRTLVRLPVYEGLSEFDTTGYVAPVPKNSLIELEFARCVDCMVSEIVSISKFRTPWEDPTHLPTLEGELFSINKLR